VGEKPQLHIQSNVKLNTEFARYIHYVQNFTSREIFAQLNVYVHELHKVIDRFEGSIKFDSKKSKSTSELHFVDLKKIAGLYSFKFLFWDSFVLARLDVCKQS